MTLKFVKNRVFSGRLFQNTKFDDWVFYNCNFDKVDFRNSSLRSVQFIKCSYNRVSWEHSDLENSKFLSDKSCIDFKQEDNFNVFKDLIDNENLQIVKDLESNSGILSSFRRCNLSSVTFEHQNLSDSDFSEADLSDSSFENCTLDHCCFNSIRFIGGNGDSSTNKTLFGEGVSLVFADFSGTNLKGLVFSKCKSLEAVNFSRSDLAGARFSGESEEKLMSLYRSRFDHARLVKVTFEHCEIDSASFIGGDLQNIIFKGKKTSAKSADFSNAYLPGCKAENIDFRAAKFSNAFIESDELNGSSDFSGADLRSADFINAALVGVRFDRANLECAIFDSALFRNKDNKKNNCEEEDEDDDDDDKINNDDENIKPKAMTFLKSNLKKSSFRNVSLNKYNFIECELEDANFDKSDLEYASFFGGDLNSCSFNECYLCGAQFTSKADSKLQMYNVSFCTSDLQKAKFSNPNLDNSDFSGSDLKNAIFENASISASEFTNTDMSGTEFRNCDLSLSNFDKVCIEGAWFDKVNIDLATFIKVQGNNVRFESVYNGKDDETRAVIFKYHKLHGKFITKIKAAVVDHGQFIFDEGSQVTWLPGLQSNSAEYIIGGSKDTDALKSRMIVNDGGVIANSKLMLKSDSELHLVNSLLERSYVEGLNVSCKIINSTIDSCTLDEGWKTAYYDHSMFNNTNLIISEESTGEKVFSKISLNDLKNFDKQSIAALKKNSESLGNHEVYDHFFCLEMKKEIEDKAKNGKKEYRLFYLIITNLVFLLSPLLQIWFVQYIEKIMFPIVCIVLLLNIYLIKKSWLTFLGILFDYGNNLQKIARSVAVVILYFSAIYCINDYSKLLKTPLKIFYTGLHYSVNTFVTIGYSEYVPAPKGIMLWYSNIESLLGVLMMALLVATIIRRTSGR